MVLYVLNTLITPINFDEYAEARVKLRKITISEAREILASTTDFVSAVGHEATAKLLSQLLGIQIPAERRTIFMRPGDKAIHFFLKVRLPEGIILTEEQLRRLDYWLVLSEVEESP
jgi:hypothetical protein